MSFQDTDTGLGYGVQGTSATAVGVNGRSKQGPGVRGRSDQGPGVKGQSGPALASALYLSDKGVGVLGESSAGVGVVGRGEVLEGVTGTSVRSDGVRGSAIVAASSGVLGTNAGAGNGVGGISRGGNGVFGQCDLPAKTYLPPGSGVFGLGKPGYGVYGYSPKGPAGVIGLSDSGIGVFGQSGGQDNDGDLAGVYGENIGAGPGVEGHSNLGPAVLGWTAGNDAGVRAEHTAGGVALVATSSGDSGYTGTGIVAKGLVGVDAEGDDFGLMASGGIVGVSGAGPIGVGGTGTFMGVQGSGDFAGIAGTLSANSVMGAVTGVGQNTQTGVHGQSVDGNGVYGYSESGSAIYGRSAYPTNRGGSGWAGNFWGAVEVTGPVYKSGGGFKIDHPLAPANMYLSHSFVESDEMKNVYDGVVKLDRDGRASVRLPKWFETLNRDFRYQLTALGGPAPDLHVAAEIRDGRFRIAGGKRGVKVSWQVTGVRRDAWADANRIQVEQDKPRAEIGTYRHPELHGKSDGLCVEWLRHPGVVKILKQRGKRPASWAKAYRNAIEEAAESMRSVRDRGARPKKAKPARKRTASPRKSRAVAAPKLRGLTSPKP